MRFTQPLNADDFTCLSVEGRVTEVRDVALMNELDPIWVKDGKKVMSVILELRPSSMNEG